VAFFSHGVGGSDALSYQIVAAGIVRAWDAGGVRWLTADELGNAYKVALPCHVYAAVMRIVDNTEALAPTAVAAFVACLTCLVTYRFALMLGATERAAQWLLATMLFGPAFLYYTSDCYKDGINAFLTVSAVALATANARRFSVLRLMSLGACLFALWFVRPYMVALCSIPLAVGVLGVGRVSLKRLPLILLVAALFGVAGASVLADTEQLSNTISTQFEVGTAAGSREYNALGGSGVVFDDGGKAWGALHWKLLYTLLAPFPWSGGSIGMQIGKLETVLFYAILLGAWRSTRALARTSPSTLVPLLSFAVPTTIAYALTMSNVGLIVRQRLPVVMVLAVLASLSWFREGASVGRASPTRSRRRARVLRGAVGEEPASA
jgi:hypothetical protein